MPFQIIKQSPQQAVQNQAYAPPIQQAIQRSQYLAQALQDNEGGAQTIRSGLEFGARLLAQGILQHNLKGANADLANATAKNARDQAEAIMPGLFSGGAAPAPGPAPQVAPQALAAALGGQQSDGPPMLPASMLTPLSQPDMKPLPPSLAGGQPMRPGLPSAPSGLGWPNLHVPQGPQAPQMASQAPQMAPQPPPMAQPPQAAQQPQGIPTGPGPTPQELELVKALIGNPQTYQEGLAYATKLRERGATPAPLAPNYYYDKDGQAKSALQFQSVPGVSPSDSAQRGPDGRIYHDTIPGVQGPAPEGTIYQNGRYVPVQGGQPQVQTAAPGSGFAPGTVVERGPNGKTSVLQQPEYGPAQLAELRNTVVKSDEATKARESITAYQAMIENAGSANGMSAYAMRDTFARAINPGAVARQGTIQAIKEAQGVPENVKSFFLNLTGNGNMSPEMRQQVLDATLPFVQANYRPAQALNDSNAAYAKRHGINPEDVTAPLPPMPQRYVVPGPPPKVYHDSQVRVIP